jgi:protein-tyrosine phosphatase
LRLPTVDTTPPKFEDLLKGVEFIQKRLADEPEGKVLIHCKGGRARACCMALSYYMSIGMTKEDAFEMMYGKRSVLVKSTLKYDVIL